MNSQAFLFLLQPGVESDLFHWDCASDKEVGTFFHHRNVNIEMLKGSVNFLLFKYSSRILVMLTGHSTWRMGRRVAVMDQVWTFSLLKAVIVALNSALWFDNRQLSI